MPFDNIMFKLKYCVIRGVQYKFSLYRRRRFLSTIVFVSDIMRQVKWQTGGFDKIKARPAWSRSGSQDCFCTMPLSPELDSSIDSQ